MGRLTGDNIEQYKSGSESSKGGYFSLKNDKEVATVRFLYRSAGEIEGFTVHKVRVGDRDRYVNCIADTGECPFCQAGLSKFVKIFVPLYNEDAKKIQIWERGQKFYGKLSGLCARYSNLVGRTFEIERNGKPKDTKTTYEIFPVGDADGTTLDDILDDCGVDELANPLGTIILDKSADDMEYYLRNEEFPSQDEAPVRRRSRTEEPDDLPFEKDEEQSRRTGRTRRTGRDMY